MAKKSKPAPAKAVPPPKESSSVDDSDVEGSVSSTGVAYGGSSSISVPEMSDDFVDDELEQQIAAKNAKEDSVELSDDLGISVSDSQEEDGAPKGYVSSDNEEESEPLIPDADLPADKAEEEIAFAGDLKQIKQRIDHAVTLLTNWTLAQSDARLQEMIGGKTRKEVVKQLQGDCSIYYGWNLDAAEYFSQLFSPTEMVEWYEANETPRPVTARINTMKIKRKDIISALVNRGVTAKPLPWTKHGLTITESTVAPGATPEYLAGFYLMQSAASMVPVCALGAQPGETIVDMASAPGGKTTHIGQLLKNKGLIYANELDPERVSSLQGNIYRMGIRNAVVTNFDGCHLPKVIGRNTVDRVLLDAPCTGSGIAAKDEQVKAKRGLADFRDHGQLQKRLLKAAIELVNPNSATGGVIVYSTCSVSVEENEQVVDYVLRNCPVKLIDFEPSSIGTAAMTSYRGQTFHPSLNKARRFYPHKDNMDGFFVAKFKKTSETEVRANKRRGEDALPKSAKKLRRK